MFRSFSLFVRQRTHCSSARHLTGRSRPFSTQSNNTVNLVKELRKLTSAGVSDCKKALDACNNDITKARAWLKEQGKEVAQIKGKNVTGEGFISLLHNMERTAGVLVEMNSETDFMSRTPTFTSALQSISIAVLKEVKVGKEFMKGNIDINNVKKLKIQNETVGDILIEIVGKLQENLNLRRAIFFSIPEHRGVIGGYVHQVSGVPIGLGVMAALIAVQTDKPVADRMALASLADQLAVHIVGMSPNFVTRNDVPEEFLQKYLTQRKQQGERIDGETALKEIVLMEQEFVLDNSKTVKQVIEEFSSKNKVQVEIKGYHKLICGEGIEKKEHDFAQEVAMKLKGH
jgi:elongation factor Ts